MKMHDWIRFVESWGLYVLASSSLGDQEMEFLAELFRVLRLVVRREFDTVGDLRQQVLSVLAEMEWILPATDHAMMFHAWVHVTEAVVEWGSVQGSWMFRYHSSILTPTSSSPVT
jgi:hypothetical protein